MQATYGILIFLESIVSKKKPVESFLITLFDLIDPKSYRLSM